MKPLKLDYFKTPLSKHQIQDMAIDKAKEMLNENSAIDSHILLKKINLFITTMLKENEKQALMEWGKDKADFYTNINHVVRGDTLNLNEFEYRQRIAEHLKEIDDALKKAQKSKDPQFVIDITTGEVRSVPVVSVKSHGSETLNVRI
jgi:hypothetical protein